MEHRTHDDLEAPLHQPGVTGGIRHLTQELRRVLGEHTEFCLVIAQETAEPVNIQAVTNTDIPRAHQLLRVADQTGFEQVDTA